MILDDQYKSGAHDTLLAMVASGAVPGYGSVCRKLIEQRRSVGLLVTYLDQLMTLRHSRQARAANSVV